MNALIRSTRLKLAIGLALAFVVLVQVKPVMASGLPFKDGEIIRLICPYGPGGGFDRILRMLQPHLEEALNSMDPNKKVSVIVENRNGAGGRVAYEYTYASEPDGTKLVLMGDQGAALQQMALGAKFDISKFTYLARVNYSEWGILVRKDTGIKTMQDLIDRSQKEPILFGSSGAGSGDHIASILVEAMLKKHGVKFPITHVHFGSSGKVRASMQRGESEAYIGSIESVLTAVKDGYGHMAVVFAKERSSYYPDTPTIFEQKIPGAEEITDTIAITRVLVAPPGIPADREKALVDALKIALTNESLKSASIKGDLPISYGTPAEARASVKTHSDGLLNFEDIVRESAKGK